MRLLGASLAGLLGLAICAHAQDYPAKPVRIIVPLAPGGLGDQLTRVIAQKLTATAKQPRCCCAP